MSETMSDDAKYLDECLRLRGGVSPEPDDDRAIRNVLTELAAARRERDEAKQWAQNESAQSREMLTALNASRAALEDVRRALGALWAEDTGGLKPCGHEFTCCCAGDLVRRALAQEAGDAAK